MIVSITLDFESAVTWSMQMFSRLTSMFSELMLSVYSPTLLFLKYVPSYVSARSSKSGVFLEYWFKMNHTCRSIYYQGNLISHTMGWDASMRRCLPVTTGWVVEHSLSMANQDASGWLYVPSLEACCWWLLYHRLQLHQNLKTKDTINIINIAMEIEHINVQSDFHVLQSCINTK